MGYFKQTTASPSPIDPALFEPLPLESWTMTDASGVVTSVTDGDDYTDVLCTANTGDVYWTLPLTEDFQGQVITPEILAVVTGLVGMLLGATGWGVGDELSWGLSSTADPSAGVFDDFGMVYATATTKQLAAGDNVAFSAATAGTLDHVFASAPTIVNKNEFRAYAQALNAGVYAGGRTKTASGGVNRLYRYLMVRLHRAIGGVATVRFDASIIVHPTPATLTVTAAP